VLGLQVGNRAAIDCLPGLRDTLPANLVPLLSISPPEMPPSNARTFSSARVASRPSSRPECWTSIVAQHG
jgi:hypothetical protein